MTELTQHAGDCTIYSAMTNGRPYDGICTCGYGWQLAREGDGRAMLSDERFGARCDKAVQEVCGVVNDVNNTQPKLERNEP